MVANQDESKKYIYGKNGIKVINLLPELDDFEKTVLRENIEEKLFDIFSGYTQDRE